METADFASYLLTVPNLLIVAAVWSLIQVTSRILPSVIDHPITARLMPLVPIAMCSAAVWLPGSVEGDPSIATRIYLGIVLGAMVGHAHKILRQTALGHDDRIVDRFGR